MAKGYFHGQKGGGKAFDILNFPLSVQPEQPTAKAVGHVWVKLTADEAAQITHVVMDDAIRLNYTDGYLIFKLPDAGVGYESITQPKKTTSGVKLPFAFLHQPETIPEWQAGYTEEIADIKYPWPSVNYRLGGSLKPAEAFAWDGVQWVQFSFNSSYIVVPGGYPGNKAFYLYDTSVSPYQEIPASGAPTGSIMYWNEISPNGKYLFFMSEGSASNKQGGEIFVYSLDGAQCTFLYNQVIPLTQSSSGIYVKISVSFDSKYLFITEEGKNLLMYRISDTALTLVKTQTLYSSASRIFMRCSPTENKIGYACGGFVSVLSYDDSGNISFLIKDTTIKTGSYDRDKFVSWSADGKTVVFSFYNNAYIFKVNGNSVTRSLDVTNVFSTSLCDYIRSCIAPDAKYLACVASSGGDTDTTIKVYSLSEGSSALVASDKLSTSTPYVFFSADGKLLYIGASQRIYAKAFNNGALTPSGQASHEGTFPAIQYGGTVRDGGQIGWYPVTV